jgi:iron complex outermembrane receptor protein
VGNANLKNEIANSFTAGGVLHPQFVRGLTLTVDYVSIRLKQAISAFSPDQVLNACYDSTSFATNPFCALVQRDATHQLSLVTTSFSTRRCCSIAASSAGSITACRRLSSEQVAGSISLVASSIC